MKSVLINTFRRLMNQKSILVLLVLFTTIATIAAVFVSTGLKQTWDIAVVSKNKQLTTEVEGVTLTFMNEQPEYSNLISGKYDAVLSIDTNGKYQVNTIKSEKTAQLILDTLNGKQKPITLFSDRGIGTNIVGFLMMFLLLMGSMILGMFCDDREQKQITRIAASPIKITTYILAHSLFNFCFLCFPTMLILYIIKWISGVDFGYSFIQLISLISLICAFSTAFSLLLYATLSNKADSAKMSGNMIVVLTSILAGSFYAFDKENSALEFVIRILPQKAYLFVAQSLEQGADFRSYFLPLLYMITLIVIFFVIAIIKTKREYVNSR